MKRGFGFQRARGTGKQVLSKAERKAKAAIEAQFADCQSYVEAKEKLEKMASKSNQEQSEDEEARENPMAEMMKMLQSISDQQTSMNNMLVDHDRILNPTPKGASLLSKTLKQKIGAAADEDAESPEDYVTSDTDDEDVDEERLERRKFHRRECREKRLSKNVQGDHAAGYRAVGTARRSTKDISNEDYCDYLETLAQECYQKDKKDWGPCPVVGTAKTSLCRRSHRF